MRIGTLFSGIGSPEQACKRVFNNDFKLVFACEWDKYARQSFNANYEIDEKHFHKDINDMNGFQYRDKIDIIIGGSPCQDFSLAGLRAGIDGQKGILIYQYIRIIKEINPPYFIYENVKGMLSDKNGKTLKDFLEAFREMGYFCHYEVLNTKDYGIPQNRERIFIVGFKDKEQYYKFNFAPKEKLEKRLKDILEDEVDEKYYLSDKMTQYLSTAKRSVLPGDNKTNYSPCLIASYYKTPTDGFYIKEKDKLRKLTPMECFRLQDFPNTFKFVVSDTQLYKQSGNSISVNVMEMILRQLKKVIDNEVMSDRLF